MCPDWKSSLQRVLSYQIHLSFRWEEQDCTPRSRVLFSVLCISPVNLLFFLLSPLSASQHIVRRKHTDKCSSISWAHNSVSWGTVNLIHSKASIPSVILSLTYILNEILNAFFIALNKTLKVLLSLQPPGSIFAIILCITCLNIMTLYIHILYSHSIYFK